MAAGYVLFGTLAVIAGTLLTIFGTLQHRDTAYWFGFLTIILSITALACWGQDQLWQRDLAFVVPGNRQRPKCPVPSELMNDLRAQQAATVFILGNSAAWLGEFPEAVIRQVNEPMLWIERESEQMFVSAKIFDKDGNILCQIDRNRIHPHHGHIFRIERPSRHRLVVLDNQALEILDIDFINPTTVRILGDFYIRRRVRVEIREGLQKIGPLLDGRVFSGSENCFYSPSGDTFNLEGDTSRPAAIVMRAIEQPAKPPAQ